LQLSEVEALEYETMARKPTQLLTSVVSSGLSLQSGKRFSESNISTGAH